MKLSNLEYNLPEGLIAQKPLERRDDSRLMILRRKQKSIEHRNFRNLPDFLAKGDILVLNHTKVIPARLSGIKEGTGGKVEVLLLNSLEDNIWEALVKPGRRLKVGKKIKFGQGELWGEVIEESGEGRRVIQFECHGDFMKILERAGEMPLPPYIKRRTKDDRERYQTVYAKEEGAVASPTAGLHFSEELLAKIKDRGVKVVFLTLHLGLGSFRPIRANEVERHQMPSEFYRIPDETAETINGRDGRRIIAVGTSTTRALETVAPRSARDNQAGNPERSERVAGNGEIKARSDWTQLFIYPNYQFQMIDALITNFHLPRSSNLLLTSAFAGSEFLLSAYREAIKEGYRFYSFGDAMLIL